ncbi:ATP-binding protein [Desulfonatronovibrio magnus]|uniref:ATP-binding protein n=1 Tax=Desulfonatronovibrio magnus TaxID=698827 RepID=UPI000696A140|nr:ATP-binding protein [Desulfonatronovibrio magnus]
MRYKKEPAFINRQAELGYLSSWIEERPEHILFLYGPKSSGKTTLLYQFIKRNLPRTEYDIKHFNLRELLLINYESFLRAFFELKDSQQVKETRAIRPEGVQAQRGDAQGAGKQGTGSVHRHEAGVGKNHQKRQAPADYHRRVAGPG